MAVVNAPCAIGDGSSMVHARWLCMRLAHGVASREQAARVTVQRRLAAGPLDRALNVATPPLQRMTSRAAVKAFKVAHRSPI